MKSPESDTPLEFDKLERIRSYQHVVDQIQAAVCDGRLKHGDRLPSELKLTRMFAASRGTIREALRVLEQKGLIAVKTGVKGGPRVREANTRPMRDNIGLLIQRKKVSLAHLAQFRVLLEGYAAERAADQASPGEIAALTGLLDRAARYVYTRPDDWRQFHEMDAQFHLMLAGIARNPLLEANLKTIHDNIQVYFRDYLPFSRKRLADNLTDLMNILDAVRQKDRKRAKSLAESHVARFNRLMEEGTPDGG